jgi:hypothetical protein
MIECYRALGHGGWAPPTLGFLFAAGLLFLVDLVRVPLTAPAPAQSGALRDWRALGKAALWPAAGVVTALLTHLYWGASEKAFIYFRF